MSRPKTTKKRKKKRIFNQDQDLIIKFEGKEF